MNFNIGEKLRKLRKLKGLSILKLSELAGVSTGQISQIEREMVTPSVVNLWKLSQALGVHIDYFFDDASDQGGHIIRSGDHKQIVMNKGNDVYQILSPDDKDHQIDFMKIVLQPNEEQSMKMTAMVHDGEECGYVLSGTLTVMLNGKEHVLEEGDSIYFRSKQPHVYMNKSDKECVSIWAMSPLFF